MSHQIQQKGFAVLIPCLQKLYQSVSKQTGTFDLSLDGNMAELKAKGKPFKVLDFISYTENQFKAIRDGSDFDTYIVCGVSSSTPEVYRLQSHKLQGLAPSREVKSYEYDRRLIQGLVEQLIL
jgi:hypothetical protein